MEEESTKALSAEDLLKVQNQQLRIDLVSKEIASLSYQQTILQYKQVEIQQATRDVEQRRQHFTSVSTSLEAEKQSLLQSIASSIGVLNTGDWSLDINTGLLTKKDTSKGADSSGKS